MIIMELPYIFLQPDKLGVIPKGLGQPMGRRTPIKYNEETIEQNYENAILEFSDTDADNSQFLFIELNSLSPWNSKVKEMLKNLNLELIKVFSPKIIIVKIAPNDIPQFKEKIKAKHKYIKETVKNLGKWTGPRKIFSSLIEKKQGRQKVILSTFENLNVSERQKLRSNLESKLNRANIKFNYNEDFFTYACEIDGGQITNLANETFIDNIRPITKLIYSET